MHNVLITGTPGVGKTTLVKKLVDIFKSKDIDFDGFYTEEVRNGNARVGFDIVMLNNGKRGILARKNSLNSSNSPMVGQYAVHVNEFEELVLHIFEKPKKLMIIDEIGKMEMFSKKFQAGVRNVFNNKDIRVIATVPLNGGPLLVKQLKERSDCSLITVSNS
ncbi:unnamed protein product [Psylliodes chrysocephalus]|uniref:AAA+ ATPase domain-containing protein n=1 Tax=Psylliodes chrysocephalus TaxID=3402493 RepID=A0A9P0CCV2_9CUCU|nr:unnamed protein product [Psylliodes chrysocephala]